MRSIAWIGMAPVLWGAMVAGVPPSPAASPGPIPTVAAPQEAVTPEAAGLEADRTGAEGPMITEEEFLAGVEAGHPLFALAREEVAEAEADLLQAGLLDNPALRADLEDPDGPGRQIELGVAWQLPHASRSAVLEARRKAVEAAREGRADLLLEARLAMKEVYAEWALATARSEQLLRQVARVEALARREGERAKAGEASGLAARRLELAAAGLRARLAAREAEAEAKGLEARRWHESLPSDARPSLPSLPDPPPGTGFGTASEHGGAPPRLRQAEVREEVAALEVRAAERFVLSPELSLGWQRQEMGSVSLDGPLVGVSWSVPLFDRRQGERALARARHDAARARAEWLRREVAAERAAAAAAYRRLAGAVDDAQAAVEGTERLRAGAEAAFRLGEASVTDLLDTLSAAAEAEAAVLDLYADALAAGRAVEALRGEAPEGTASAAPFVPTESSHPEFTLFEPRAAGREVLP